MSSVLNPRSPARADGAAVLAICALSLVTARSLVASGVLVGLDTATQYYPWYVLLGQRLRAGDVPAWNPYSFSGAPFAADPLSGWTYLPAMLLFALLPAASAVLAFITVHLVGAALAAYALARALGLGVAGAGLAAAAYGQSGFLYFHTACCSPFAGVALWLPLALLGVERAARSSTRLAELRWCAAGGVALSQLLAVWPGHGALYSLLAIGWFVAYRSVIDPPSAGRGIGGRVRALATRGAVVLLFGFGLAAAGLLPRVEYNALSGLAGGYLGRQGAGAGGWALRDWARLGLPGSVWYAGATVASLACLAPFTAGRTGGTPYFASLALGSLILALRRSTPLHGLLGLLPGFDTVHAHLPERVVIIAYLAIAILAGSAVDRLARPAGTDVRSASLALLPGAGGLLALALDLRGLPVPPPVTLALLATAALLLARARFRLPYPSLAIALALAVFVDLSAAGRATVERRTAEDGLNALRRVDLRAYYAPSGAERFLRSRSPVVPPRFAGYAQTHALGRSPSPETVATEAYTRRWTEPGLRAIGLNNRAVPLGLGDVQGYNAVHLARYDEYLEALNGRAQNYHDADVFPQGLRSPLLDILGVRYLLTPARASGHPVGLEAFGRIPSVAYADGEARVVENREALPKAWIVHEARSVERGEALGLLGSGEVDPRRTALLEAAPPVLEPVAPSAAGGATEYAAVTSYEPEEIRLQTSSAATGLLVLGEVAYPGWKAYVDGMPTRVYLADHVLRAVPVPRGEHSVVLRFESAALRAGLGISAATGALLVALVVAGRGRRRYPRREASPTSVGALN